MEKRKPQCSIGRNVSGYSHYGIYDGGFSKIKNRTTIWNNNLTSGYISKRLESRILRYFTPMFIEVLCTKTKRSKQSTPSLDEKMNEVWYICYSICLWFYACSDNVAHLLLMNIWYWIKPFVTRLYKEHNSVHSKPFERELMISQFYFILLECFNC